MLIKLLPQGRYKGFRRNPGSNPLKNGLYRHFAPATQTFQDEENMLLEREQQTHKQRPLCEFLHTSVGRLS